MVKNNCGPGLWLEMYFTTQLKFLVLKCQINQVNLAFALSYFGANIHEEQLPRLGKGCQGCYDITLFVFSGDRGLR